MRFFDHLIKPMLCVGLLLSQSAEASAKIEHWQTNAGGEVYFVQTTTLPIVDIQINFDAGSVRDGKQFGLASLTASLLDTGAGEWDANQIAQRLESVGAVFSATSNLDMASVSLRTLSDKPLLDKAFETLQVILTQPRFALPDFERERSRTIAALKQEDESPAKTASLAFYKALYGDHPYGQPTDGTLDTIANLHADDVNAFYQRYYVASNATMVIVGNLSLDQAKQRSQLLLDHLPTGTKAPPLAPLPAMLPAKEQHIEFPSTQTHVLVGLQGTYRLDPDYFDLYVGNHILGGASLVSKLFDEIREKRGLAYSASSNFIPLLKPGPFVISLQTRNDQTQQALQVLQKTLLDYLQNGPSQQELDAAKQNLIGGFAMRFDTNKELASYVGMIAYYHLPLDYLETFTQKIDHVSVESIKQAFARHVNPAVLQTITVGRRAQ